ncbi:Phytosulfokine [Dendrobium catenatum]|uniref:Phytosulfokine n=1 Tax=Dendrobium catenatum TaxID=906689 RepID=A0A2I0X6C4_9ASPA|nr:Phytosulfokine [Dendrobium catenatum]
MSTKQTTSFFLAILLFLASSVQSTRPLASSIPLRSQEEIFYKVEQVCEGVGEEECLMRRTLAAQVDYIYTQENHG